MTLDYYYPSYCTEEENQGSERSADLPKVIWLIGGRVGIGTHAVQHQDLKFILLVSMVLSVSNRKLSLNVLKQ